MLDTAVGGDATASDARVAAGNEVCVGIGMDGRGDAVGGRNPVGAGVPVAVIGGDGVSVPVAPAGARVGEGSGVADWSGTGVAEAAGVPGVGVSMVRVAVQVAVGVAAVGDGACVGGAPVDVGRGSVGLAVGGGSVGSWVGGTWPVGVGVGMV